MVPFRVDDGQFDGATGAQQNGIEVPSFPFASMGDLTTFIYRVPMRVDAMAFVPPIAMQQRSFPLGLAYLVDLEITSPSGAAFTEYDEIYACLPISRSEYGTASGTFRYQSGDESLRDYTELFDATYRYDYSLLQPLPTLIPWRLEGDFTTGIQFPGSGPGGSSPILEDYDGDRILLDTSHSRIWRGLIYERMAVYVKAPPFVIAF